MVFSHIGKQSIFIGSHSGHGYEAEPLRSYQKITSSITSVILILCLYAMPLGMHMRVQIPETVVVFSQTDCCDELYAIGLLPMVLVIA